jgi:hypothetical protein
LATLNHDAEPLVPVRPKPSIHVTSRKVDGDAASTSVGSVSKQAFMSTWKMP